MAITNTAASYGAITKLFHWLTALLIFTAFPLGLIASDLAHQISDASTDVSQSTVDRAALLFSLHKTIGVTIFLVALARILWAFGQRKPGLLNGDNTLEAWAAETVHWLLYGSLLAVPLTGWVHHAATTGFAPIWWPFGQTLPFVPRNQMVSEVAAALHYILQWVLLGAITLHIAGAMKHHFVDGDATLRRMLPGRLDGMPSDRQPNHVLPFLTALAIWAAALGGGAMLGWFAPPEQTLRSTRLQAVESDWKVQSGTLTIEVMQMGSTVTGQFNEWTADITYAESPDSNGRHGDVTVTIAVPSLELGSVTDQAMGADFLAAESHPTATFTGDIFSGEKKHVARGSLTIKDRSIPLDLPFTLDIKDQMATAEGSVTVDRRDFGIGMDTKDPSTLGFSVTVNFKVKASRAD